MEQMLLLVNPVAGQKKAAKNLTEIIEVFNRADYDVCVYITSRQGDIPEEIKKRKDRLDLVVCCGGDGTLNETVNGILQLDRDVPIGYIPAGSTNDFAGTLGLSGDVVAAAKQIVNGVPKVYDVGRFMDRHFTYVASFGAFTKTSYSTPQSIKNSLGHVAYLLEGIQELSKVKKIPLRMEIEDEVLEDEYLFGAICNSTSVGGILKLKPELVDMRDGKFEILLVRAPKSIQEISECVMALKNQTYDCGMVTFRSASKIRIITKEHILWSLDGERMEGDAEIFVENLHQSIRLIH